MQLREFLSLRRAYNLVRQRVDSDLRLTFEEFAILCMLDLEDRPVKTSDIANYQSALRPTITHRTKRLASLGLIDRQGTSDDRRVVVCSISDFGRDEVSRLTEETYQRIGNGRPLSTSTPGRVRNYVHVMGTIFCTAGDLVLMTLLRAERNSLSVSELVGRLGFLQPTISMSVTSLVRDGYATRLAGEGYSQRSADVVLTQEGRDHVAPLVARVHKLVVPYEL